MAETEQLSELLANIDQLRLEVDALRPLSKEIEQQIFQKFRLEWNYNSNAIEGNKLDYGETVAFLMHGITAKGKPFKDYLDVKGHNEAIDHLVELLKENNSFTEVDIRNLHKIILVEPYETDTISKNGVPSKKTVKLGSYKSLSNHVKTVTGETHYYASPEETPAKMYELMEWLKTEQSKKELHPVIIAALFHHKFEAIHPFDDGNGRLGRILMNLILMQSGFPPVIITKKDRENYYLALSQADSGNNIPIIAYIGELLLDSLKILYKGASGEDIYDREDIDKEIELLKVKIKNINRFISVQKEDFTTIDLYWKFVRPIGEKLQAIYKRFSEFFFREGVFVNINGTDIFSGEIKSDPQLFESLVNNQLHSSLKDKIISSFSLYLQLADFKIEDIELQFMFVVNIEVHPKKYTVFIHEHSHKNIQPFLKTFKYSETPDQSLLNEIEKIISSTILKELKKYI